MLVKRWRPKSYMHDWGKFKMAQLLWKTIWQFLIKLNMQVTIWPYKCTIGHYSRKMKVYVHVKTYKQQSTALLFTNAKTWEHPRCPSMCEYLAKL
jgi:hypothetical protein